ncbi:hypothetical protein BGW42_007004 [Actinomortierella wolfii]|nr:hypothetical protein BGW42_007004 [Actinomortierella wolfii]
MKPEIVVIPELVALVAKYLGPSDLLKCVQLNKSWNDAFIPHLWRSIDDTIQSWPSIIRAIADSHAPALSPMTKGHEAQEHSSTLEVTVKAPPSNATRDREWLIAVFRKYGSHIRHLKIQWPLILEIVCSSETCTSLHSLVAVWRNHASGPKIAYYPHPHLVVAPAQGQTAFNNPHGSPIPDPYPELAASGDDNITAPVLTASTSTASVVSAATTPLPSLRSHSWAPVDSLPPAIEFLKSAGNLAHSNSTSSPEHTTLGDGNIQAKAEHDRSLTQHLWHLVRVNPGLFKIDVTDYTSQWIFVYSTSANATPQPLVPLKDLKGNFAGRLDFWNLWRASPPAIESPPIGYSPIFTLPGPLPGMHLSLRVASERGSTTPSDLLSQLNITPNLDSAKSEPVTSSVRSNPSYPPTPLYGHAFKRLDDGVNGWKTAMQLFPNNSTWVTEDMLDDNMVSQIEKYCPNLQYFKRDHHVWYLDDSQRPEHDPTNRLLAIYPDLREFESIEQVIRVEEMLRQPWVCMGLERLVCRIVGVDRLTPEEETVASRVMKPGYSATLSGEETRIIQKFNRCSAQHHGVYNTLASLTRLKHLDLGYENRYPWTYKSGDYYIGEDGEEYLKYEEDPTFDTLELSLESGLGRLATLKDLEMFGFECLNHKIGKAELDWMAKSWPKLKLMYGLDEERLYDIEPCKKRAALKEYFQKIRPDVVHDSLFEDLV